MAKKKSDKNPNKDSKKRVIYLLLSIAGAAVIVIATVLIVLWLVSGDDTPEPVVQERPVLPTGARGTVVTEDNLDAVRAEIEAPVEDASYSAVMSVEWTFERWDVPSRNARVENSTRNTRTVFFDVFLDETGERIYESPYIPVGERHDNFALDTEVPAGQYTATVVYFLVDDDYEVLTDVSVMVRLNILG